MGWSQYQRELKRHGRYRGDGAPDMAPPRRLAWHERRPIVLAGVAAAPLLGILLFDWHATAVLWAYWGEAAGLTALAWTRTRSTRAHHPAALAGLTVLLMGLPGPLLQLANGEAIALQAPRLPHMAGALAAVLAGGVLFLGHVVPRERAPANAVMQLILVHGVLVAACLLIAATGALVGYAFLLIGIKTVAQVALALAQERRNVVTLSRQMVDHWRNVHAQRVPTTPVRPRPATRTGLQAVAADAAKHQPAPFRATPSPAATPGPGTAAGVASPGAPAAAPAPASQPTPAAEAPRALEPPPASR